MTRKKTTVIKDRVLREILNLLEHQEQEKNYYKAAKVIFWSNNYIEYESKSDRIKKLSFEEYLDKIKLYLKGIINNLKKSGMWKIQLTIANNFSSFIDKEVERDIHSKRDITKIIINDEADQVIEELFE